MGKGAILRQTATPGTRPARSIDVEADARTALVCKTSLFEESREVC